jgi:rRNA pseudouridine-1189 N-methylase Emg1 (Nep1/Mra1 family)
MTFKEPIKSLRDIIMSEMGIENDRIVIYNQKWNLPNNFDIFISLGILTEKVFSNKTSHEDRGENGLYEVQTLNLMELISVDIFSADNTARMRKEEVVMAMSSTFSEQTQEKYSFKIGLIPSGFSNVSSVETSKALNRYNITIPVLSWRKKEKQIDYFDKYDYEILTSK